MEKSGRGHQRTRKVLSSFPAEGLYDIVVDSRLQKILEAAEKNGLKFERLPLRKRDGRLLVRELATVVIDAIETRLHSDKDATIEDIRIVNDLLAILRDDKKNPQSDIAELLPFVLKSFGPKPELQPPDLSDHGLLTGREGTDNLHLQLRRELNTCNKIDWLVSFIKLAAIKMLQSDIEAFLQRGGEMRVVTTAYMGATDPAALELLAEISLKNESRIQIRFSGESDATRLHAKAYIHHRDSGFGSAYIGSANLSRPALTEGLEWTVRLSQTASPGLWSKIEETFEQWWGDPEFVIYGLDSNHPSHTQFRDLIKREKWTKDGIGESELASLPIFDLQPKPFQQAILERIAVERFELGLNRHLVVAATGTGKTMVAAFDYRDFAITFQKQNGRTPRLLYIAHSERILKQSRLSFAQVMRNLNFGGFLVGGKYDRETPALFASIQSWNSRIGTDTVPSNYFDYVVVDEVHHGEADTWKKLLDWITPKSLLGLTATPERADGKDITRHFNGRPTAEIRLPDAITRRLLVPFRYFGVTDSIDLSLVPWTQRGYKMEGVQEAYLGAGKEWIEGVRRAITTYVADPLRMRAIGFCSGVAHARAMSEAFEEIRIQAEQQGRVGIRTESLDGYDSPELREEVIGRFRRGEIQLIFVADLFNEGVDIPEIDVVLFMRPTDSLTIFIQQLGRGLRLCPKTNKDCLTVLDFVGQYRKEFRFSNRLGAMLTEVNASVELQLCNGFTALPPGCSITLEPIARDRVLENIRSQIRTWRDKLIDALQQLRERLERTPTQREFIEATLFDPRVFYSGDVRSTWSGTLLGAGIGVPEEEINLLKPYLSPLRAVASLTDHKLAEFGLKILQAIESNVNISPIDLVDRRLQVLLVAFGDAVKSLKNLDRDVSAVDIIDVLKEDILLRNELKSLLQTVGVREIPLSIAPAVPIPFGVPLLLHHTYTNKQITAGFGWKSCWHADLQGGVAWIPEYGAYLMLVTLEKDEASFTERTRYRDFAITPTKFHWQSQSRARQDRGDGLHIVNAKNGIGKMWLFVRRAQKDEFKKAAPFVFMGSFLPTQIEGMRPMSITGDLANAMPAVWFEIAARAR